MTKNTRRPRAEYKRLFDRKIQDGLTYEDLHLETGILTSTLQYWFRNWAELLERVFAEDVLRSPRCGGRRHRVATITDPFVTRRILRHIRAPHEPRPLTPARPPPQSVMQFC